MTNVYTMRLSELWGREEYLLSVASDRRRERALRFRRADDRLRCLAAGYLMKRCLPGYSEERLWFGRDGKPFLRGGVPFSVSHGGDFVLLAWKQDAEGIGVDVEPIGDMAFYRSILPYAMTASERRAIGEDVRKAVSLWTRKESLYKCVGEGVSYIQELPEVLEEETLFFGAPCRLYNWERDGHIFCVALRGRARAFEPEFTQISL